MVKLRLKRIGKKQAPFYRIVAADSRVNRNGQYIELVGTFDPLKNEVKIDNELALKWLQNGAQSTDTVRDLFSKEGIMKDLHEAKLASKSGQDVKVKKEKSATKPAAVKKTAPKADKIVEAEKAAKIAAANVAKEKAEAEKVAKELAVKYAKEIAASEEKEKTEAANAVKLSTKERAEIDGSDSIDEPRSELQKHANKMRSIAMSNNIKIKDSNLRDMTKQELVKYMKQVSVKLNK